jgi:hypothetical protein
MDARPVRLFHGQPAAISVEAPFQHPFRLVLLGRDQADHVFIQARRHGVGFDIGLEPVFVLVHVDRADLVYGLLNRSHFDLQSRRVKAGSLLSL